MRLRLSREKKTNAENATRTTTITLSGAELVALGRFLTAGRVLLQEEYPPVVARLKAAMTRLRVPAPKGL